MPSIRKLRGKWQVRWVELDKSRCSRICPTKTIAQQLARDIEAANALGRRWEPEAAPKGADADTAMNAYLADISRSVARKTMERHTYALTVFGRFLTETGRSSLRVGDMSRALLVDFHAWLAAPGSARHQRTRKPGSVAKYVEVVQVWWKWLEDESPWSELVPRARRIKMVRDSADRTISPTWDEMDRCIANAYGWRKRLTMFMRCTGLRPFQCMLTKWEDVDLDRGLLVVRHGKSRRERQGRVVPISRHLVNEIATWAVERERTGWLIVTGLETARERQSRDKEMKECWQRAGVRKQAWDHGPHKAFRRGLQSGLKALGADDEAVKYLVGHDLGVRGHYLDPESMLLREAVALIPPIRTVFSVKGAA